jgi:hypothetical protein
MGGAKGLESYAPWAVVEPVKLLGASWLTHPGLAGVGRFGKLMQGGLLTAQRRINVGCRAEHANSVCSPARLQKARIVRQAGGCS